MLADVALAELKHNVVVLRAIDFVGAGHYCLAVFNEGLVTLEPVSARPCEPFKAQHPTSIEHVDLVHQILEGPSEFPRVIGGVVVVG